MMGRGGSDRSMAVMMKLRPATRNAWFYLWVAFIAGPFAEGCAEEGPSKLPLWGIAIISVLQLILIPIGIPAMCGMAMKMQRWMGHFKPWRRPSLWTNPFAIHSIQPVVLLMVMAAAMGAGHLLRLLWGDFHAAVWSLVHFSGAAGLWLGMFLSLRFFGDRFEAAPGDSPQAAVNGG